MNLVFDVYLTKEITHKLVLTSLLKFDYTFFFANVNLITLNTTICLNKQNS